MISAQLHLKPAAAVEEGGKQGGMKIGRKAGGRREKKVGGRKREKREGGREWAAEREMEMSEL